jgi:hypothetical protein
MADLRSVLTDHYERHGELVPRSVWEEARPEGAPLHHRFEWNDGEAADRYRDIQAAELIRSVRIQFAVDPKTSERKYVRAFQSLNQSGDAERSGYVPTEEIVQDELATKILLNQFKREIGDLKRKYGHLAEFADIIRGAAEVAS